MMIPIKVFGSNLGMRYSQYLQKRIFTTMLGKMSDITWCNPGRTHSETLVIVNGGRRGGGSCEGEKDEVKFCVKGAGAQDE